MRVKRHKCDTCAHPSDDHSAYRDLCLHGGCDCIRNTKTFPYQGLDGHLLSAVFNQFGMKGVVA